MKRVYLIFTLFITSFFLLSSNVSADTIIYEIPFEQTNYLLDEEFIELRKKTIEFCNENNKYYLILSDASNYSSYIFEKKEFMLKYLSNTFYFSPSISGPIYQIVDGVFTNTSTYSYTINIMTNGKFSYIKYLDHNIDNIYSNLSFSFIIQYDDVQYTINPGDQIPTLYELYLDNNVVEEETNPKLELISNFYILVIDKIKLFADFIATNYIILSSLVIFIFVSAIDLVRRFR